MTSSRGRAWSVWALGMAAYVVAVLHRTSFGVAGLDAAQRFEVSASVLAGFTVLQLLVYAGLQVPVGVLLDRFGPRRLLVTGSLVMAAGQVVLALADHVGVAYVGRALVGAGDAATFISVLRLVASWFPPSRVPVLTQLTGLTGQLGQILSAVPLVALLHAKGWTTAFVSVAAVGVVVAVAIAVAVHDEPGVPVTHGRPVDVTRVWRDLRVAFRHPGTRLGLWTHFTTQFSGTAFVLMWGFPFLVSGEGLSRASAGRLLSAMVFVGLVSGPLLGVLVQRHPLRRSWLVLAVLAGTVVSWTAVLAWPGRAPLWLLVVLVVSLATNGPASMIGFDFARTFNPPNRLGTATGIVNVGGFFAALTTILLVGVLLDVRTGGASSYGLDDFRVALLVQYALWAVGLVGILRTRRLVRRRMARQGVVVPAMRAVVAHRIARRRRRG
ncbi:MAG: MFS transporter [Actinobacteria bacterium]|nr:MFS transporter [Actinomycetota bacterium]